ncbi:hypothetical protein Hanom_Chr00s006780g01735491 [Helianthus anomalus]
MERMRRKMCDFDDGHMVSFENLGKWWSGMIWVFVFIGLLVWWTLVWSCTVFEGTL